MHVRVKEYPTQLGKIVCGNIFVWVNDDCTWITHVAIFICRPAGPGVSPAKTIIEIFGLASEEYGWYAE